MNFHREQELDVMSQLSSTILAGTNDTLTFTGASESPFRKKYRAMGRPRGTKEIGYL
jgi:hypothetical protein